MRVLHEGSIQTGALNSSSGDLGVYQSINIKGLTARIIVIPSNLYIYIYIYQVSDYSHLTRGLRRIHLRVNSGVVHKAREQEEPTANMGVGEIIADVIPYG